MNWAILATGTIAAKFAETVNGMKGEDRLAACGSRSREKAEAFGRKYGIPGHMAPMRSFSGTKRWTRSMWQLPTICIMQTVWHVLKQESMCYVRSPLPPM